MQTTSVFIVYALLVKWIAALKNASKNPWQFPVFMGAIIFMGIWTKLTYFAVIPGICIYMIYYLIKHRDIFKRQGVKRKYAVHLILLIAVASSLSFILLNSKTKRGKTYYQQMIASEKSLFCEKGGTAQAKIIKLGRFFPNPMQTANYAFYVKDKITPIGLSYMAALILLLVFGTARLFVKKEGADYAFVNIFLAVLTFFILVVFYRRAHGIHHVVLCFPYMLISLLYIGSKLRRDKIILALVIILLSINIKLYINLSSLRPRYFNPLTKIRYLNEINEKFAEGYVYVVIDSGYYFIKHLYGPNDQCVLNLRFLHRPHEVAAVRGILKRLNRKALFICRQRSAFLKKNFPGLMKHKFDFDTRGWNIWYQP